MIFFISIASILSLSYFAYERGHRNVFENPRSEYGYGTNGEWIRVRVSEYVSDQARDYHKKWNKMLDINARDSKTFTTFEKEALCEVLDGIYALYKVCLVMNASFEKSRINTIFNEAVTREFPENSINRLIVNAARPEIAKEFNLI